MMILKDCLPKAIDRGISKNRIKNLVLIVLYPIFLWIHSESERYDIPICNMYFKKSVFRNGNCQQHLLLKTSFLLFYDSIAMCQVLNFSLPLHSSTTASHNMMYTGKFIYDSTVVIFRHLADNYCAHKICLNIFIRYT